MSVPCIVALFDIVAPLLLPSTALFKACSYGEVLDLARLAAFLNRGETREYHITKSQTTTDSVQLQH